MSDQHQRQALYRQAESCAEALHRQIAESSNEQRPSDVLIEEFHALGARALTLECDSFQRIAACVCRSLSCQTTLSSQLQQINKDNLTLAADWLVQLSRICNNSLPEPKGLVFDLIYSFYLLERAARAEATGSVRGRAGQGSESFDIFAEDPVITAEIWQNYVLENDLFSEDPGFGHLFDLFQRTLSHVAGLVDTSVSDPFGNDPGFPTPALNPVPMVAEQAPAFAPVDPFAFDPPPTSVELEPGLD